MSNFIGGGAVECGPSNALKDVGALVERDYGAQRVSTLRLQSFVTPIHTGHLRLNAGNATIQLKRWRKLTE